MSLVRTLRVRTHRKVGDLGMLATALGDADALIGEIQTVKVGHNFTIRDFALILDDADHLQHVIERISDLNDSQVEEIVDEVKAVHLGGKIRTSSRVQLDDLNALNTASDPGVREVVQLIDDDPSKADLYTSAPRTVGVVSDGAGLLGVGKVAVRAMLPVLEAKSALLASKSGLSSIPLALDVSTEDEFVQTVIRVAPSFGALLLDAVAAPRNLRINARLTEALKIPVFDDDADAPAVTGLAAVINACRRTGRDINKVTVGQIGLGTAGGAIAALIMKYTGNPVLGEDVHPEAVSRHVYGGGEAANLEEIMERCDVVVANTGHGNVIGSNLVREGQVIIALSEPRPEITPYDATLAGAAFAADGKAVNKAACMPGILLGALAVQATRLDDEMRIAAALILADSAEGGDLVPTPLVPDVHAKVASAVANAAMRSGAATRTPRSVDVDVFEEVIADRRQLPLT